MKSARNIKNCLLCKIFLALKHTQKLLKTFLAIDKIKFQKFSNSAYDKE